MKLILQLGRSIPVAFSEQSVSKPRPTAHSQSDSRWGMCLPFVRMVTLLPGLQSGSHHCPPQLLMLVLTHRLTLLYIYTLTPVAQPALCSHTALAGGRSPSPQACIPVPGGYWLGSRCEARCYRGTLETLDFTKEEGSRSDPRPLPLNLDSNCAP